MYLNAAILAAVVLTGVLLWSPRLRGSTIWRAMTTPLASIIGSGFLVLGPVLDASYGKYAPAVMAALCLVAYLYGAAVRFNIADIENNAGIRGTSTKAIEQLSSGVLGFAYIISVAYYLNLFGAFGVSLTSVNDQTHARLLTTAVFALILFVGRTRGFKSLERMEYVSVSIKLAIIAGLLVGLGVYFLGTAKDGGLVFNEPKLTGWPALALAFGLIVTVQGFETSRYLSEEYASEVRIQSMRWAQWTSSAIYMTYICLLAYVFQPGELKLSETTIVDMMGVVAPILPALLVAAALAAQFSAAVADTSGSGGLMAEITKGRLTPRMSYVVLVGIGIALTWAANVFEIISYASRAFALYYALQASIAAIASMRRRQFVQGTGFVLLAILGMMIAVFGQPVE